MALVRRDEPATRRLSREAAFNALFNALHNARWLHLKIEHVFPLRPN